MAKSTGRTLSGAFVRVFLGLALVANPIAARGNDGESAKGKGRVVLAGIQFSGRKGKKDENLETIIRMVRQAAARGGQVMVTPEIALTGYMNSRAEKELAEPIPGPSTERIAALAKELGVYILLGMPELRGRDYSNAVAVIGRDGSLMGVYRKIVMNYNEAPTGCLAGDAIPVWRFETETGAMTAGVNICADMSIPEHARVLALKGADVILHPLGSFPGGEPHRSILRTRAFDNDLYIFLVNHAGPRMNGNSMVADYRSNIVAKAGRGEETFLYEVDIDALNRYREVSSRGKHSRRPELYGIMTNPALQIHPHNANLPLASDQYRGKIISHRPEFLILSRGKENAGCPEITLRSTDNEEFAIEGFRSPDNCITVDYDPSVTSATFVVQPKVDVQKLLDGMKGQITIRLSHPKCATVTVAFDTSPRFTSAPSEIKIRNAEAQKPVVREVSISNGYRQYFEVASGSSQNGFIKMLKVDGVDARYRLELEITPPAREGATDAFSDVFTVLMKGGGRLEIPCSGSY